MDVAEAVVEGMEVVAAEYAAVQVEAMMASGDSLVHVAQIETVALILVEKAIHAAALNSLDVRIHSYSVQTLAAVAAENKG